MSRRAPRGRPAALVLLALALLLTLGGCASLGGAVADGPVAAAATPVGTAIDAPVVRVEVDAPGALKDLLDRHLDLSRLARLTRGDAVTDTELSRLIDAAPAQVRDLLQTEGYFSPTRDGALAHHAGRALARVARDDRGRRCARTRGAGRRHPGTQHAG